MTDKNNILLLFDRPTEPLFIGKGENNVSFDVPPEYYVSFNVEYVFYVFLYIFFLCKLLIID